jgi:hypothetical protein
LKAQHFKVRDMLRSIWATIGAGQSHFNEEVDLPEGARLLVTVLPENENQFWLSASQTSLAAVWDNAEDDAYGRLLEK